MTLFALVSPDGYVYRAVVSKRLDNIRDGLDDVTEGSIQRADVTDPRAARSLVLQGTRRQVYGDGYDAERDWLRARPTTLSTFAPDRIVRRKVKPAPRWGF